MQNTRGKQKSTTILWLLFLTTLVVHYCSIVVYAGGFFSDDDFMGDIGLQDPLRSPPRRYPATFSRNNTGYIWGGEGMHSTESFRDVVPYFNIINVDTEKQTVPYDFVENSQNYKNFASGAAAIVDPTNKDRMLFFGGYRENRMDVNEDVPIYIEQYDFISTQWISITPIVAHSPLNTTISPPRNRAFASATTATDGNIYITGGILTNLNSTVDTVITWKYDPTYQIFSPAISQENTAVRGESLKNVQGIVLK